MRRIKQVNEGNYDMQKDRNYYRLCDTAQLLIEAKEGDSELALVLAERLQDALHDIEVANADEIRDLEDRVADLEADLDEARATITTLEAELEDAQ
jgi:hypothetical protein